MQLRCIEEFSDSAKKNKVNTRYQPVNANDGDLGYFSDEEEKSEIGAARAPGPSTLLYQRMYGIGPLPSQHKVKKIASAHSSLDYSTDDEAEQP